MYCLLLWFLQNKLRCSQDCPSGYVLRVQPLKSGETKGLCLKCYYVKRGSFGALKNNEFAELVASNANLRDKSFD